MSWAEIKKVNSNMKVPLNEGGVKVVKRVQRGIFAGASVAGWSSDTLDTSNKKITISAVDPNKSILLINGEYTTRNANRGGAFLENSTTISIPYDNSSYQSYDYDSYTTYSWFAFTWQVIEFY